jgi:hypothetical protein
MDVIWDPSDLTQSEVVERLRFPDEQRIAQIRFCVFNHETQAIDDSADDINFQERIINIFSPIILPVSALRARPHVNEKIFGTPSPWATRNDQWRSFKNGPNDHIWDQDDKPFGDQVRFIVREDELQEIMNNISQTILIWIVRFNDEDKDAKPWSNDHWQLKWQMTEASLATTLSNMFPFERRVLLKNSMVFFCSEQSENPFTNSDQPYFLNKRIVESDEFGSIMSPLHTASWTRLFRAHDKEDARCLGFLLVSRNKLTDDSKKNLNDQDFEQRFHALLADRAKRTWIDFHQKLSRNFLHKRLRAVENVHHLLRLNKEELDTAAYANKFNVNNISCSFIAFRGTMTTRTFEFIGTDETKNMALSTDRITVAQVDTNTNLSWPLSLRLSCCRIESVPDKDRLSLVVVVYIDLPHDLPLGALGVFLQLVEVPEHSRDTKYKAIGPTFLFVVDVEDAVNPHKDHITFASPYHGQRTDESELLYHAGTSGRGLQQYTIETIDTDEKQFNFHVVAANFRERLERWRSYSDSHLLDEAKKRLEKKQQKVHIQCRFSFGPPSVKELGRMLPIVNPQQTDLYFVENATDWDAGHDFWAIIHPCTPNQITEQDYEHLEEMLNWDNVWGPTVMTMKSQIRLVFLQTRNTLTPVLAGLKAVDEVKWQKKLMNKFGIHHFLRVHLTGQEKWESHDTGVGTKNILENLFVKWKDSVVPPSPPKTSRSTVVSSRNPQSSMATPATISKHIEYKSDSSYSISLADMGNRYPHQSQLDDLMKMGYGDPTFLRTLLEAYNGDLKEVIPFLIPTLLLKSRFFRLGVTKLERISSIL